MKKIEFNGSGQLSADCVTVEIVEIVSSFTALRLFSRYLFGSVVIDE